MSLPVDNHSKPICASPAVNFAINLCKIQKIATPMIIVGVGVFFAKEYFATKTIINFSISSVALLSGLQDLFLQNIDLAKDKNSIFVTLSAITVVASMILCSSFIVYTMASYSFVKLITTAAYFLLMSKGINQLDGIISKFEGQEKKPTSLPATPTSNPTYKSPSTDREKKSSQSILDFCYGLFANTGPKEVTTCQNRKGFANLGNTCWLNAALKSIITHPIYVDRIQKLAVKKRVKNTDSLNQEQKTDHELQIALLENIVLLIEEYKKESPNFTPILSEIRNNQLITDRFTLNRQCDAGEFFQYLEGLEAEGLSDYSKDPVCSIQTKSSRYFSSDGPKSDHLEPGEYIIKLSTMPDQFIFNRWNFDSQHWQEILRKGELSKLPGETQEHFQLRKKLKETCLKLQSVHTRISEGDENLIKNEIQKNILFRSLKLTENPEDFIESLKKVIFENPSTQVEMKTLFENFYRPQDVERANTGNISKKELYHDDCNNLKMIGVQLPRFYNVGANLFKDDTPIFGITDDQIIKITHPQTLEVKTKKLEACSIVCHEGILSVGHYFSFVKENGQWFCHNDGRVTQVTDVAEVERAVRQSGYMINYNVTEHPNLGLVDEAFGANFGADALFA